LLQTAATFNAPARQTDKKTEGLADTQAYRQTDRQTGRHTDGRTDRGIGNVCQCASSLYLSIEAKASPMFMPVPCPEMVNGKS